MKKLIIASLAAACAVPFANAGTLYNTMDPMTDFPYDEFISPNVTFNSTNITPVVDDVTFNENVNISSFSCRILTSGAYNIGDELQGYLYIIGSNNGAPGTDIIGLNDGLFNFQVTGVYAASGISYGIVVDLKDSLSQNLASGQYWFGVQLLPENKPFYIAGNHYGEGDNALVYKDGAYTRWTFGNQGQEGTDLSMKIEGNVLGEPAVPGPAAILPFGIGLAAAIRRRRK